MTKFKATVIREIQVEVDMPEGFSLENDDENYESVEEFTDKVYAAVPDGIVHRQSITAFNDKGEQVL